MNLSRFLGVLCLLSVFAMLARADVPGEHLTSRALKAVEPVEPIAVGTEIDTREIRKRVVLPDGSTLFVDRDSKVKVESGRQIVLLAVHSISCRITRTIGAIKFDMTDSTQGRYSSSVRRSCQPMTARLPPEKTAISSGAHCGVKCMTMASAKKANPSK